MRGEKNEIPVLFKQEPGGNEKWYKNKNEKQNVSNTTGAQITGKGKCTKIFKKKLRPFFVISRPRSFQRFKRVPHTPGRAHKISGRKRCVTQNRDNAGKKKKKEHTIQKYTSSLNVKQGTIRPEIQCFGGAVKYHIYPPIIFISVNKERNEEEKGKKRRGDVKQA